MKVLTLCQPYADLLLLPDSDPRHKRTENRPWYCTHRGPLAIHAGKSRSWIVRHANHAGLDEYGFSIEGMVYGAILGVVDVVDWCAAKQVPERWPALAGHQHIEGPYCAVIERPRRFVRPIPFAGGQMLIKSVPDAWIEAALQEVA